MRTIDQACTEALILYNETKENFTFYFNECKIVVRSGSTHEELVNHYYLNVDFNKYFK